MWMMRQPARVTDIYLVLDGSALDGFELDVSVPVLDVLVLDVSEMDVTVLDVSEMDVSVLDVSELDVSTDSWRLDVS